VRIDAVAAGPQYIEVGAREGADPLGADDGALADGARPREQDIPAAQTLAQFLLGQLGPRDPIEGLLATAPDGLHTQQRDGVVHRARVPQPPLGRDLDAEGDVD